MQLIVMTNWDEGFLDGLDSKVVKWVSGRLPRDSVGGSSVLPENMIKKINKRGVEKYIKQIHSRKFKFNYLLDGHCTSNKEYSWYGANKMLETIKWISDSGADGVTVVLPHLVQIIKKDYPHLKVGFGGSRIIWELTRVKYYDSAGVSWIILHASSHRSFRLLKALRNAVKCELWLVANTGCLLSCNFGYDHDNFVSHASNYTAPFAYTDYFNLNCNKMMLERTEELIKCPWIRPEDLSIYESLGYDKFIIQSNTPKTEDLVNIITAYKNRQYNGNLLDILSAMGKKICQGRNGSPENGAPFVDNRRLDNVIDFFVGKEEECFMKLCKECRYCRDIADKAVIFSHSKRGKALLKKYARAIEKIEDGR